MSLIEQKGEALYKKLRAQREELVAKYNAGGTIRYDEAIGLIPVGGNPALSTAPAAVGGALVNPTGRKETRVVEFREDGALIGTRVVLDLAAIKAANIADGIPSGTMMDALKKRASGKTILLFPDDAALRWGTVILGEVPCQLKLMGNIVNAIRNAVFPGFQASNSTLNGVLNTGLIHALPGYREQESLSHRGFFKPHNYRGDVEYMKDPTSIWATVDASRQSIMSFGINSEIRMWGDSQVIDFSGGFSLGAHERPNRVAAFSSLIDLSDGHFSGLSTKGATNAHIYSSGKPGVLARNNHFAIRGHFVRGLLIENMVSGDASTLNHGSYFGSILLNDPSEVVVKDFHQTMLNKAVSNSSMALSHYAQLFNIETLFGYWERPSLWETSGKVAVPWMKWEPIAVGAVDTFGNGKTTRLPVIKTEAELQTAGVPALETARVRKALTAALAAFRKSMKSADDTYLQSNTGHNALNVVGADRAGLPMNALQQMTSELQIPRSTNLIAQNPRNAEGTRYPDSVAYGFRAGSASEGTGALATSRGGTVEDCYLMDCSFEGMHISPMEMPTISSGSGSMKTFNGNGLRIFGYSNANGDAHSMAPSLILMSKEAIEDAIPESKVLDKPVDYFDTAAKAVLNYSGLSAWTAKKAHGLYKGNDVVEAGLAAIEAAGLLKKYFRAAAPTAQLAGLDNSNVDIGILGLRKSMMNAIDALTANHVGLKGGFNGDIFTDDGTYYGYGEIYPWFVKSDGSEEVDKDVVLSQPQARIDRRQTTGYVAKSIPDMTDAVWKLKLVDRMKMALVKADTEAPVTYEEVIALLGFGSGSGPVEYTIGTGLDGQGHTHKGIFGIRFDAATRVMAKNIVVRDMEIVAKRPVQYLGSADFQESLGIAPETRPETGILEIHGVSINAVTEAKVEDLLVEGCHTFGSVYGVEIAGQSSEVVVEKAKFEDFTSGDAGRITYPFGEQKAVGVKVDPTCATIELKKITAGKFETDMPHQGLAVEILTTDIKIS